MRINVFKSGGNSAEGGFVSNGLTLQGPLILSGPHTDRLHAVPKQYVDNATYNLDANNITSGVLAAARLPAFTGDATTILGTSNLILANTGVTPGSIIKPTVDAKGRVVSGGSLIESDISGISFEKINVGRPTTLNGYGITDAVSISNNVTMQGDLILSGQPTSNEHAATKSYVDTAAGVAGGISVGDIIRKPYTTTPAGFLKCNGGEVEKSAYPNLYSVIGDSFQLHVTNGAGRPWQHQYEISKNQSTDLLGWTTETSIPSTIVWSAPVVTKNRVYLIGGWTGGSAVSTVYSSVISANGSLGTWTTETAFPITIGYAQSIVTKNRVYIIGGVTATGTVLSSVYTANINSDGTLGTWSTSSSLPSGLSNTQAIVIKNRVYLIGGNNGSAYISTIYTNTINDDGTINSWSVYGTIPVGVNGTQVTVIKNRIYVIGGVIVGTSISNVYYAEINADGTLGSWNYSISMPAKLSLGQIYTTSSTIYYIGGWVSASNTAVNTVYKAPINSDGSIGTWTSAGTLPTVVSCNSLFCVKNKLYSVGYWNVANCFGAVYSVSVTDGLNDYSSFYGQIADTINVIGGSGKPWQQQYQINTTQSTDITGWTTGTALPSALGLSQSVVTKNRVYLLGGHNGTSVTSAVLTAPINADGTLGTWTNGTALPGPVCYSQAIVAKNKVFVFGGSSNASNMISAIYSAPINSDGTLGTWVTETSLPVGFAYSQAILTKNRIHLIGGNNGSGHTGYVYTTTINNDGSLGVWTTGNSLPGPLVAAQAIVTKNRVYVCSGSNGAYTTTVYTSAINADGTLGVWSAAASLPGILGWSQSFVTKGRAYLLGGTTTGNNAVSTVYTAPINADGTLGTWVSGTSLPSNLYYTSAITVKNRIYLLGGHNASNVVSTVYTATISSNIQDYSPYYDGTIEPVSIVSSKFKLPDYTLLDKEFGDLVTSYIKF